MTMEISAHTLLAWDFPMWRTNCIFEELFSLEDQSWDSTAFSVESWVCAFRGGLLAGRVRGSMWGTCCIWLSFPPYEGTPRDMLDSILIWGKKKSLSGKWIWDKVLEVRALLRKEATSYTVFVYPNQDISLYSLSLVYLPLLFMLSPTNTTTTTTEYVGKKQTPKGVTWQAVGWKGNAAPHLPEPTVSNEQNQVLRLYYSHSPSQIFCVSDGRDELERLPTVRAGSGCPLAFAERKHKWEGWAKFQSWFLLGPFCLPLFCLISYSK